MEKPTISSHSPREFRDWDELGALVLTPKFQRREVWKTPARSYFIESLLRGFPIPPIFLRLGQSKDKKRVIREVIDGQQRLRTVLEFMNGKYALTPTLEVYGGMKFSELDPDDREKIENFTFLCEVFQQISDKDVLEVFARVNTYSVPLNDQELRNGRYFGPFKQTAYALALDYLEFWRSQKIFTETSIARMSEVELTSELMIALIDGQQDKKKSINHYYELFDEKFPKQQVIRKRFTQAADEIAESIGNDLRDSEFRRVPLFYTLFCVVSHRLFGLPGETAPSSKRARLAEKERTQLKDAIIDLSDRLVESKEADVSPKDQAFITACLRQTDNIGPRKIRFERLFSQAFLA